MEGTVLTQGNWGMRRWPVGWPVGCCVSVWGMCSVLGGMCSVLGGMCSVLGGMYSVSVGRYEEDLAAQQHARDQAYAERDRQGSR